MNNYFNSIKKTKKLDLFIIALLTILFGIAEIITGFKHDFFGITTQANTLSTIAGVSLGLIYAISGIFILTLRKSFLELSVILLIFVVIGRILMVIIGLFPLGSFLQTFSIIVGTSIAAIFAIYVFIKLKKF